MSQKKNSAIHLSSSFYIHVYIYVCIVKIFIYIIFVYIVAFHIICLKYYTVLYFHYIIVRVNKYLLKKYKYTIRV